MEEHELMKRLNNLFGSKRVVALQMAPVTWHKVEQERPKTTREVLTYYRSRFDETVSYHRGYYSPLFEQWFSGEWGGGQLNVDGWAEYPDVPADNQYSQNP